MNMLYTHSHMLYIYMSTLYTQSTFHLCCGSQIAAHRPNLFCLFLYSIQAKNGFYIF